MATRRFSEILTPIISGTSSALSTQLTAIDAALATKYEKPAGGIPFSDMSVTPVESNLSKNIRSALNAVDPDKPTIPVPWVSGNMSAAIQAAFDTAYLLTTGAKVLLSDPATYVATGLVLPPRVDLYGTGTSLTEIYPGQTGSLGEQYAVRGTVLKQAASATTPLIRNDPDRLIYANSYIRQYSNCLNDSSNQPLPQVYQSSTIRGITFTGDANNQTELHDLISFERCWAVDVEHCNIMHCNGYGVRLMDCNTINFDFVISHYAPWFIYDTADSQFQRCSISGSNRFGTALWLHSTGTNNLVLLNNLIYNSSVNDEAQWTNPTDTVNVRIRRQVSSIVTGVNTELTIASHKLYDEYPVVLNTAVGATLPTGLLKDRVYWVRRTSGNTIKLAENPNLLRKSVFVTVSDTGTGTWYVDRGPAANVVISGGAARNQLISGRVDQSYGDGVLLLGSAKNTIVTNVNQSGLGSSTPRAGVRIRSGYVDQQPTATFLSPSSHNVIGGNIDGVATTYGSWNTNQAYGISVDDVASERGLSVSGCTSVNHSTANFYPGHLNAKSQPISSNTAIKTRTSIGDATDLTYQSIHTFTLPAGSLGTSGHLEFDFDVLAPNNTYARKFKIVVGGSTLCNEVSFTNLYYPFRKFMIWAEGSGTLRSMMSSSVFNSASAAGPTTATIAHGTQDISVQIQVAWGAQPVAGDTISLRGCHVAAFYSEA